LWVLREFRAEFYAALPTISKRIAYLATPYHADILRPRLLELNRPSPIEMEVQVFTEELSAQQWLQGYS